METQTQNEIIMAQVSELMRVSDDVARKRELNRILALLLEWDIQLTPVQLDQVVGDVLSDNS